MNPVTPTAALQKFLKGGSLRRPPLMPITMMFAADRLGVKYGQYASDYRVLVEAQIRTAEEFGFDYVSVISDPAREASDLGAKIAFFDNQPPAIDESHALLEEKSRLAKLQFPDPLSPGRMHDRVKAAELFRLRVGGQRLIEGWVEGPCAYAADFRGINTVMLDFFDDANFIHDLFAYNVELALRFARAQVQAGVDLIGIGDAAASLVGPEVYDEFVWPYEKKLVDGLHAMDTMVRLHICGNTRAILSGMGRLGCEIVDLDSLVSIEEAREQMGPDQILLGNINPVSELRNSTPECIRQAIAACHQHAGDRYIVGAGCEIPRDTSLANVHALRQYIESIKC